MALILSWGALETSRATLDTNSNQLSDVWESLYSAQSLVAAADTDGDGFSNLEESIAGTDPRMVMSRPEIAWRKNLVVSGYVSLWPSVSGKTYRVWKSETLTAGSWTEAEIVMGDGAEMTLNFPDVGSRMFVRLEVSDEDADADGLSDSEEIALGYQMTNPRSQRRTQTDLQEVTQGWTAASQISVSIYDDQTSERWPDPLLFVVRREGGLQPLTVNFNLSGTALRNDDYTTSVTGTSVNFGVGQREAYVEVSPLADAQNTESDETVILTATAGTGYSLVSGKVSATGTIQNATSTSGPSAKEAARFFIQAAFGPSQDAANDTDEIPENVETVMQGGFSAWISDQYTRPIGYLQPMVEWLLAQPSSAEIYGDYKLFSWWGRAMELPRLRPDSANTQLSDPLRQRVAFALSQILVVSDRPEVFANAPYALVNYYDLLVKHAFGNYRDLLYEVTLHPSMGQYLSHLGNQKPDLVNQVFPDENYAREIMQLFSIGLWELNNDGTQKLDAQGQPIPTYDNQDITEFAKVFTGLTYGDRTSFGTYSEDYTQLMKGWDAFHDLNPKTLLRGTTTPSRTPSPENTGTATLADINAAIDNLFQHPNVGPFIGRLLIQRLVTSNPSPAYIGRVAAAFDNNGQGVRGDMKAVISAILLDPDARDYEKMIEPTFGKLREPFLKCVNLARAFNAKAQVDWYPLDTFNLDHVQQPMNSPSVFNFYLPNYSPPGPVNQQGLVAPEFQILNATSVTMAPNYFYNAVLGGLHRWGVSRSERNVLLDLSVELPYVAPGATLTEPVPTVTPAEPEAFLRRLDLVLTGGQMLPETYRLVRDSVRRVPNTEWEWALNRMRLPIILIVNSPDFSVIR